MKKTVFFYRTIWGVNLNFNNFSEIKQILLKFKSQGFQGIEIATGFFDNNHKKDFMKLLQELDLGVITQIHTMGYPIFSHYINEHFNDYKSKLEDSLTWNPAIINCHTGRDDWETDECLELFRKISDYEMK